MKPGIETAGLAPGLVVKTQDSAPHVPRPATGKYQDPADYIN